jgi:hypothetical protein
VSAQHGRVGEKCRHLSVRPTCCRHVGDSASQAIVAFVHFVALVAFIAVVVVIVTGIQAVVVVVKFCRCLLGVACMSGEGFVPIDHHPRREDHGNHIDVSRDGSMITAVSIVVDGGGGFAAGGGGGRGGVVGRGVGGVRFNS